MAAIAVSPTSGTAVKTVFNVNVTATAANTSVGYNASNYPASPQVTYRVRCRATGQPDLFSEFFSTGGDQAHTWPSVIFPAAGSWTVTLRDSADNQIATTSVVIS